MPPVESPCVRNCCLDLDDVCVGCHRSIGEIVSWSAATDEERQRILRLAGERAARRDELRARGR